MHGLRRCLTTVGVVGAFVGSTILALPTAGAAAEPTAPASPPFSAYACAGSSVVDVTAQVSNEADGGASGNVWALLDVTEHMQVFQESSTLYCVVETDAGRFHSFAGTSPGGTGTVGAHRTGLTLGIQRFELNATLHPTVPVSGSLGKFNFKCDQLGNCPGNVRFSQLFFSSITGVTGSVFAELDISNNLRHGSWFQSTTTNYGDITG